MKTCNAKALKTCLIIAITTIAVACQKSGKMEPTGHTSLNIYLTDDPSLIFDAVYIDIEKLEVKTEDDSVYHESEHESGNDDSGHHGDDDSSDDNSSGGWVTLNVHPGIFNLLNFRNGLDTILATGSFPSAHAMKKIRLTLGSSNSVVYNGNRFPLLVKDNNNEVIIKLEETIATVSGNGQIDLSLDFDAGRSIRMRGNTFELKSNIKAFSKDKAGRIEGRVLPVSANPVIYAINGTDTSSAKPEREGEFKLVGLKPGTYTILVEATANNYQSTTIQSVIVTKNEDTHLGTITLHQ